MPRVTPLEEAREHLDPVGFVALRDKSALAGTAPVEIALDLVDGQRQTRWAAVDDDTDATPMRLAECGDAEDRAEGAGHVVPASTNARKLAGDEPMRRA